MAYTGTLLCIGSMLGVGCYYSVGCVLEMLLALFMSTFYRAGV